MGTVSQFSRELLDKRTKMFQFVIGFTLIQGLLAQQCFDLGGCQESPLLGAITVESTNQCLKTCKETEGCQHITYDHTNGFCGLYLDCVTLDGSECEQCLSGPVTCDYIQCGIPGQCIGIFEYQQTAQTQTDCKADAIAYGDVAMWYT